MMDNGETISVFATDGEASLGQDAFLEACIAFQIQEGYGEGLADEVEAEADLMLANSYARGTSAPVAYLAAYRMFAKASMRYALLDRGNDGLEGVMRNLEEMLREARRGE